MLRAAGALILLGVGTAGIAAETDFGIREVGKPVKPANSEPLPAGTWGMQTTGRSVDMGSVKQIGAKWGQVTSTFRSPEHKGFR